MKAGAKKEPGQYEHRMAGRRDARDNSEPRAPHRPRRGPGSGPRRPRGPLAVPGPVRLIHSERSRRSCDCPSGHPSLSASAQIGDSRRTGSRPPPTGRGRHDPSESSRSGTRALMAQRVRPNAEHDGRLGSQAAEGTRMTLRKPSDLCHCRHPGRGKRSAHAPPSLGERALPTSGEEVGIDAWHLLALDPLDGT